MLDTRTDIPTPNRMPFPLCGSLIHLRLRLRTRNAVTDTCSARPLRIMLLRKLILMLPVPPLPRSPQRQPKAVPRQEAWTRAVSGSIVAWYAQLKYASIYPPNAKPEARGERKPCHCHRQPVLTHPHDEFCIVAMPRNPSIMQVKERRFL